MALSTWWLAGEDGLAKRVTPSGLLLGRSAHCDLVLRSEEASRRHAMVFLGPRGPRIVPLGRGLTRVGSCAVTSETELADGDRVELPDIVLTVSRRDVERVLADSSSPVWVVEGPRGGLFGMTHSPFLIGGSPDDDVVVEGWKEGALTFHFVPEGLEVEPNVSVLVAGVPLDVGESRRVRRGDAIEHGSECVKVVTGGEFGDGSTVSLERGGIAPSEARLEFLPRGGRLHLKVSDEWCSVYLTDRRCDLVAVLLSPPEPFVAGGFIEDEQILARVWGKRRVDRTHLNVLLHRVRKDLARIGLDGAELIQRAAGGGATRFVLAGDAKIVLD